jgi:hypothetical protein
MSAVPRSARCRAALGLLLLLAAAVPSGADRIDRVMAVVGGQAITWSDVRAARALGLVPGGRDASDAEVVDGLIVRELMRAEVDRFSVASSEPEEIDARVAAALERFGPARGPDALDAIGMSEARLRAWLDNDARIERYLQQRFDVAAQPTDEEVLTYFQSRERDFFVDGQPRPFAAVRADARARLLVERRRLLIDEWVAGLRRRASIAMPAGG